MIEIRGDLWSYEADALCITTNGFVNRRGNATMGAGCALEAVTRYPGIARTLGSMINMYGNITQTILSIRHGPNLSHVGYSDHVGIVSFPVKHHWKQNADPELIKLSAEQLVTLADGNGWNKVVIPRPGCGNGRLKWENVKPILEPILDDRFQIITW